MTFFRSLRSHALHSLCFLIFLPGLLLIVDLGSVPALAQSESGANRPASRPWMNPSLTADERAALVVKEMTIDEKISLLHGTGMKGLSPMSPLTIR